MQISVEQWIVYGVIALTCGILGQMLARRSIGGFIITVAVGLAGAFAGEYIARYLGAQEPLAITVNGRTIPVLWPIVGATVGAFAVAIFQRKPSRARA